MLGGLFGGKYSFSLLFFIITGLCLWEYFGLTLPNNSAWDTGRKIIGLLIGLSPFIYISLLKLELIEVESIFSDSFQAAIFPGIFALFIVELISKSNKPFDNIAHTFLGIVYLGVPFVLLVYIAFIDGAFNPNIIFGILLLTWANDNGRLFCRIKTWENTLTFTYFSQKNLGRIIWWPSDRINCGLYIEFNYNGFKFNSMASY